MNKPLFIQRTKVQVENATGLGFVVNETNEGKIKIRPVELLPGQGFHVLVEIGLNRLQFSLQFENYSEDIRTEMIGVEGRKLDQFFHTLKILSDCGCNNLIKIDGQSIIAATDWPSTSKTLQLESVSNFLETNDEDVFIDESAALTTKFTLLPILLLDLENEGNEIVEPLPEGALQVIQVNKYERSRINRQLCIDKHGPACAACGFDFEEHYGEAGTGFIEVHHILPVSEMGEDYTPDPETELVPLCSNCHSIVHRRKPPFTIDEIRSMLKK